MEKASNVLVREFAKSCDLVLQKRDVIFGLLLEAENLEGTLGVADRVVGKLDDRAEARS